MLEKLKTPKFWECAAARAIRTVAQTIIASIGTTVLISEINWYAVLGTSLVAGLISILTSIVMGIPESED